MENKPNDEISKKIAAEQKRLNEEREQFHEERREFLKKQIVSYGFDSEEYLAKINDLTALEHICSYREKEYLEKQKESKKNEETVKPITVQNNKPAITMPDGEVIESEPAQIKINEGIDVNLFGDALGFTKKFNEFKQGQSRPLLLSPDDEHPYERVIG